MEATHMTTKWTPDIEKQARVGYSLTCKHCGSGYNDHYPHPELPCPITTVRLITRDRSFVGFADVRRTDGRLPEVLSPKEASGRVFIRDLSMSTGETHTYIEQSFDWAENFRLVEDRPWSKADGMAADRASGKGRPSPSNDFNEKVS
jgi:hypothetical protein